MAGGFVGLGLALLLGLLLGRLVNEAADRLSAGTAGIRALCSSVCPRCGGRPRPSERWPLLGVWLHRRCCPSPPPRGWLRHALAEVLLALVVALLHTAFGTSIYFFCYTVFAGLLLTAAVTDLETGRIPDLLTLPGSAAGLLFGWWTPLPGWLANLAGLLLGGVLALLLGTVYETIRGRTLIGGGDIKLLGMIGAFLGWRAIGPVLLIASVSTLAVVVWSRLRGRLPSVRFAPYLALGSAVVLVGPELYYPFFGMNR